MGVCLSLCPSFSPVCLPAYTYLPNDQSVSLFVCLLLQSGLSLSLCVCGGQLIRSRSGEKHSILGTSSAGSGASQAAQAGCPLPSLPFLSPASLPAPHTILLLCSSASGCSVHNLPQLPFVFFFHLSLSFTFHICLSCFLSHCCCPFSPPLSVCSLGTISSTISSYLSHYVFISFFL